MQIGQRGPRNTSRFPKIGGNRVSVNGVTFNSPTGNPLFLPFIPYNVYAIDLTNAFTGQEFTGAGTTIWPCASIGGSAQAWLQFENTANASIPIVGGGPAMNDFPFSKFYISNTVAQAGITLYIATFIDLLSLASEIG